MKMKLLLLALVSLFFLNNNLTAETGLGIFAGFSSPNNEFNNISPPKDFTNKDITDFIRDGMSTGYHIGAKLRYGISDNFTFIGSASWHKFPESNIIVPIDGNNWELKTTSNIIPITAGVNFYLINSVVGIYGTGEISYNYIYSSIDAPKGIPFTVDKSPTESRVGFGLGVGADVDIVLATLNLEAKYSIANFIGKATGENNKNYFSISLGVFF